jgi:hypothetical protein
MDLWANPPAAAALPGQLVLGKHPQPQKSHMLDHRRGVLDCPSYFGEVGDPQM